MKRIASLAAVVAIVLAGCGSSSKTSTANNPGTAAGGTAPAGRYGATTAGGAQTSAASGASSAGVPVAEKEFSIALTGTLKAGANELDVKNSGSFPHELKVIKADSFASLPKGSDGTVDESKLASGALVAKTDRVAAGASATLPVTLAAGTYVLVCNLGTGANSHAAKGMHIDVTVG